MSEHRHYLKDLAQPKPKKRKRLNPQSTKRKATNVVRRAEVEERYGRNPECYACGPLALLGITRTTTGCRGWADDAHEIVPRGRGGSIVDTDNIVPISRSCHSWVHANEDVAQQAGLLRSSYDTGKLGDDGNHGSDGSPDSSR